MTNNQNRTVLGQPNTSLVDPRPPAPRPLPPAQVEEIRHALGIDALGSELSEVRRLLTLLPTTLEGVRQHLEAHVDRTVGMVVNALHMQAGVYVPGSVSVSSASGQTQAEDLTDNLLPQIAPTFQAKITTEGVADLLARRMSYHLGEMLRKNGLKCRFKGVIKVIDLTTGKDRREVVENVFCWAVDRVVERMFPVEHRDSILDTPQDIAHQVLSVHNDTVVAGLAQKTFGELSAAGLLKSLEDVRKRGHDFQESAEEERVDADLLASHSSANVQAGSSIADQLEANGNGDVVEKLNGASKGGARKSGAKGGAKKAAPQSDEAKASQAKRKRVTANAEAAAEAEEATLASEGLDS